MAWNLADEINTDENVDSLFDSLPTQTKALERDEAIRVVDAGGDLNTSPKGSFVPNSDGPMKLAPVLESPKEKAVTDSALGEVQSGLGKNVLETFEAPKVQAAGKEALPDEEYEEEPEEEYLGRTLHAGATLIASLEDAKLGRTGRNAREVAREKALDNQAIEAVKNELRRNLAGVSYPPEVYDILALREGGGIRPAEEITELIRIRNNRGVQILNDEGREAFAPANNWEDAKKVYDLRSAQQRKLAVSGKTGGGGRTPEELTKAISNLKSAQEAYAAAQSTGDSRQISAAKIGLELAEDDTNQVSGGRLYQERHQATQNSILKAIGNQGNPKINWGGVAYDDPSLKNSQDPTAKLSAEQYLASQVTNGTIPTVTFTKNANGEVIANADAALNYVNKAGVKQTLVATWDGPNLNWFNFTPSEKPGKQLVPLTKKASNAAPPSDEAVLKDKISKLPIKQDQYKAPAGRGGVLTAEQKTKLEQERVAAQKSSSLISEKAKLEEMIYSYQGRQKKLKYDANDPSVREVLNKIENINKQLQSGK